MIFQQLLTIVRTGEELWDLRLSPDHDSLFVIAIFVVLIHHWLIVFIIWILWSSEVCKLTERFHESSGLKTIC